MKRFSKKIILNTPIAYLPFPYDFIYQAERMELKTIRQIIDMKQVNLESKEYFTNQWMNKLSELAEQYDFLWELEHDKRYS